MLRRLKNFVTIAVIVGLGVVGSFFLLKTKPHPQKKTIKAVLPTVETITVSSRKHPIQIEAIGQVQASKTVTLQPQVSGVVVYRNPAVRPGNMLKKGSVLYRIDNRDYRLSVEQQRASVTQAELQLAQEKAQQQVAEQEWRLMADQVQTTPEGQLLARRQLQLKTAMIALQAARSNLQKAQLALERTVIRAPFDAIVTEKLVDVGQMVTVGTRLASVSAGDLFWISSSLPVERLSFLALPGFNAETGRGSIVSVRPATGSTATYQGRIIGLRRDVTQQGHLARILIAVPSPLHCPAQPCTPLLLGSTVGISIQGQTLKDTITIPRLALRSDNQVWIRTTDNRLELRPVTIAYATAHELLIADGLKTGEQLITSSLRHPAAGMQLGGQLAHSAPQNAKVQLATQKNADHRRLQ